MRPLDALLSDLRTREIRIWVDGDRLRFKAPEGALVPERGTKSVAVEAVTRAC